MRHRTKTDGFRTAMLLRNVLRAFGITPILMSTQSGAMNATSKSGDSRQDRARLWCRLVVKLPPYIAASEEVYTTNPCLSKTERPWIAKMMVDDIEEKNSLTQIVKTVQETIQIQKSRAWDIPALQLCQLFRCKPSENSSRLAELATMHRVVGSHFDHVEIEEDFLDVSIGAASQLLNVRFVEPEKEPVLFLALTSWTVDHLSPKAQPHFPLLDSERAKPLTIMEAFDQCGPLFSSVVSTANPSKTKLNGDDLEVLALAAVTLASLQHDADAVLFTETPLPRYLATVACLMRRSTQLSNNDIEAMKSSLRTLLPDQFSTRTVPPCPCPCVESHFDDEWQKKHKGALGGMKRPPDREMRDGAMVDHEGAPVLHLECKNYTNGVTMGVFKAVVSRMRKGYQVAVCFASSLNNIFTWGAFTSHQELKSASELCVLIIPQDRGPYWLEVEQGQVELGPVEGETNYLLALVLCGVVAPS